MREAGGQATAPLLLPAVRHLSWGLRWDGMGCWERQHGGCTHAGSLCALIVRGYSCVLSLLFLIIGCFLFLFRRNIQTHTVSGVHPRHLALF